MKLKSVETLITKNTSGVVLKNTHGYKVVVKDGLTVYTPISILQDSSFKVINFNVYTKRVKVILNNKNISTDIVELDYDVLINDCTFDNDSTLLDVEAVLISYKEKDIIDPEKLKTIVIYLTFSLCMLLLGMVI
jgi:hypothetical protein